MKNQSMKRFLLKHLGLLLVAPLVALGVFIGRVLSVTILSPSNVVASGLYDQVLLERLDIVDAHNKPRITLGMSSEGTPSMWFFDENGKARMNFGLYKEGDPFVVLNDEQERAVEIFRTFGKEHAPVIVMKSNGRDRMVFGLNPKDKEPFFVLYDEKGNKSPLFGDF